MGKFIVSIDQGTTSSRAILFNIKGKPVYSIDTAPRMATAKALTECVVIFVSQKEFEKKLDEGDMIVRGVMAILSSRLRDLQKRR